MDGHEKSKITLTVNGREGLITADPGSSVLDAIREDDLDLLFTIYY